MSTRKEPNFTKTKIQWAVVFRKTNTGMGSEVMQQMFSDERDALAFFDHMRFQRHNVDVKLSRVITLTVGEVIKTAKLTQPIED